MIRDDRIPTEVDAAIDYLEAIRYVHLNQGQIHRDYMIEKVERAKEIIEWLEAIGGENE